MGEYGKQKLSKGAQMLMDGYQDVMGEAEQSLQASMHEEVDKRMNKALGEISDKYSGGPDKVGGSQGGPTGDLYKEKAAAERAARAEERALEEERGVEVRAQQRKAAAEEAGGSDDDEELLEGTDPALEGLRAKRLAEMKAAHSQRIEDVAKGHGKFEEIVQDEFLPTVLASARCLVHFYHPDMERCKIMDMHLARLAPQHIECKFAKINAEKAPFFVTKLGVQVIPSVVCFIGGVAQDDRVVGFEGIADDQPPGKEDEWPTEKLAERLAECGVINYEASATQQEVQKFTLAGARAAAMVGLTTYDDIDGDMSD